MPGLDEDSTAMSHPMNRRLFLARAGAAVAVASTAPGARGTPPATSDELTTRAVAFLRPRQKADGSWSGDKGPGITGLVATGLLRSKRVTPADPAITKALAYLEGFLSPKGGLAEGPQSNYVTSISLMAFHEANAGGKYDALIKGGQAYLKDLQWDEGEKKEPSDPFYGGAGYGGRSRPDLSNTAFFLEALHDTGLPADDPALRKALAFVSRCQNLKSEFNDQPWADKVNDGGFAYSAAEGGLSMATPLETPTAASAPTPA